MTNLTNTFPGGTVILWQDLSQSKVRFSSGETRRSEDRAVLDPLTPALQNQGFKVTALSEEKQVLQAVLQESPDLLIIHLPTSGEQGYEFCKVLQRLPRVSTRPVVFVGTRNQDLELIKALRCGGSDYLQMPMNEEACWLRLERHLKAVQLLRSMEAERASLQQEIWSHNHMLKQYEEAQVSLAKENLELQQMAFVDGLTHVANRRSFNETLPQLWQAAKENKQPISLLLCDIDYFKRYNDTYGHLAGDACLQAVAESMVRGASRQLDQVARYGGEEFAILLPATDSQGAQKVALAIQKELERAQIAHAGSLIKPYVSLSIGVCTLEPALGEHIEALNCHEVLIQGADEALYTAKLRGRDRIYVDTPGGLVEATGDLRRACTGTTQTEGLSPKEKLSQHHLFNTDGPAHSERPLPIKIAINEATAASDQETTTAQLYDMSALRKLSAALQEKQLRNPA